MKFPTTFCSQQQTSPDIDEFLLSSYDTIESNSHVILNDNSRNTSASEKPSSDRSRESRPKSKHVSRRWHYIDNNSKEETKHQSVLEAPFVKMKEIHISPPRYPIREDPKKYRYFVVISCIESNLTSVL